MVLKYDIEWTKSAKNDLRKIEDDVWRWSLWPLSVEKWGRIIMRRVGSLETMPESSHKFTYTTRNDIWQAKAGKYTILYQVVKKKKLVRVLRIVNGKMNLNKIRLGRTRISLALL